MEILKYLFNLLEIKTYFMSVKEFLEKKSYLYYRYFNV